MKALRLVALGMTVLVGCSAQLPYSPGLHQSPGSPKLPLLPDSVRSQAPEQETRPALQQAAAAPLPAAEGRITARVIARVNGQPILREEVLNAASYRLAELQGRMSPAQFAETQDKIIREELNQVIDRELLLQDAQLRIPPKNMEKVREGAVKDFERQLRRQREQLKIATDEEFRAWLQKQGRSVEEMQRQFERTYVAFEYLRARVKEKLDAIDREQMLEYYRDNAKEFDRPERVTWQHLFIDVDLYANVAAARDYAEKVHALARKVQTKEEFSRLAEEYGHGTSKFRKGEGEGNERGTIQPADVEELVFRLRPGEVSSLAENRRGFHIVRLIDHQMAGKVPFESACLDIKKKLQAKVFEQARERILSQLREQSHIENSLDEAPE
jgi:parvulin-like peptidyl-prolyl isomerase